MTMPKRGAFIDRRALLSVDATRETLPAERPPRVVIERIVPRVDGGRFPIKRTAGESVIVSADIFAEGHDVLVAVLRDRHVAAARAGGDPWTPRADRRTGEMSWRETPMRASPDHVDTWTAQFTVETIGWHEYQVVAWADRFLSWRRDLAIKHRAGQDVGVELREGAQLVRDVAQRATLMSDRQWLAARADAFVAGSTVGERVALAFESRLADLMLAHAEPAHWSFSAIYRAWVDRERARFGSWYEMFPRSASPEPGRSATFVEAAAQLTRIADLGFDVVYLPPIHPIGRSFRKGRNNSIVAEPGDPGSPWAIGSADGGHTAVEPGLGTLADFDAFHATAARLGLEVALDLAWQCSPDHPWVREHPDWFRHRPDGTIKHAENPPKLYQDIVPLDFETRDWRALWLALLDVTRFWIARGVRVFRVDNPHTKPFPFWEWLIAQVHATDPDIVFLSEAFTRPPAMRYLAKAGFTQSYTYFTWRNSRQALTDYFTELTSTGVADYLRPNLFANTPDILTEYLQQGGRPAFQARLLLAASLGASYGIYSGFELCEARAQAPNSEEYAESEKYQFRTRDWNAPGNIAELVSRVNHIRRAHPALQTDRTLRFHATDNDQIIAFSKTSVNGSERILIVVNLDPHHTQHGFVETPVDPSVAGDHDTFVVRDLLDDATYPWHRGWNYVRFDPDIRQGHMLWLPTIPS